LQIAAVIGVYAVRSNGRKERAVSRHGLGVWTCQRPSCKGVNLAAETHCGSCHDPRPPQSAFRAAVDAMHVPGVDLEEFCRTEHSARRFRSEAEVHVLGGQVYLTLAPSSGPARLWRVEENAVTPCDNFGRPSW
jgi:hypothetical protein